MRLFYPPTNVSKLSYIKPHHDVEKGPQKHQGHGLPSSRKTCLITTLNHREGFIPAHGWDRNLYGYQEAEIIYDGTVYFTNLSSQVRPDGWADGALWQTKHSRRRTASVTSKETEIKLTKVTRASLEELQTDYEDLLRTNKLSLWDKVTGC